MPSRLSRPIQTVLWSAGAVATLVAGLLVTAPAAMATAPAPPATAATATQGADAITTRASRYGRVIFDGQGRALYLFTRERTGKPRCYGECAEAWPPFVVEGRPRAGAGARSSLIGTTRRSDGSLQATYRGRALYYYVTDLQPGEITCQNIFEFGGTWLVVSPDGKAVR